MTHSFFNLHLDIPTILLCLIAQFDTPFSGKVIGHCCDDTLDGNISFYGREYCRGLGWAFSAVFESLEGLANKLAQYLLTGSSSTLWGGAFFNLYGFVRKIMSQGVIRMAPFGPSVLWDTRPGRGVFKWIKSDIARWPGINQYKMLELWENSRPPA